MFFTCSSTTTLRSYISETISVDVNKPEKMNSNNYQGQPEEEEEEWDRETLLDPEWEIQQKKTFTAWCNSHLRKVGAHIENIEEDFRSGLKLMLLLEVIADHQLPRPERGKMRLHKIANVNKALDFIQSKGVRLVSIGAEEIVDGNVKMTLGLIWTIILRFAIEDITVEEMTAKEGLLLWCQRKTAGYPNVNVQNFSTSWKDGLAFCALIHRHRPELLDFNKLSRDDPMYNLNLAFDVAEKHLDIPRMLDPEDMIRSVKPDERSVMAYVSSYYHAFAGQQKAETAANRICKVLRASQDNERAMEEYEHLASDLLAWIRSVLPWLRSCTIGDNDADPNRLLANGPGEKVLLTSLGAAQKELENFRGYRTRAKPPRLEQKARLETCFNTLQTRLRLNGRPPFLPTEGRMISDINLAWKALEKSEKEFEDWIVAELQRLERLDHLVHKFYAKCASHDSWCAPKIEELDMEQAALSRITVYEIKARLKKQEAFEADLVAHQDRVDQIGEIARELRELHYHEMPAIESRHHSLLNGWDAIRARSADRFRTLQAIEAVLERVDAMHLEFAKRAAPFNNWLDGAVEDLRDTFIVHTVEEIQALMQAHDAFAATLPSAQQEMNSLANMDAEAQRIVTNAASQGGQRTSVLANLVLANPYTNLTGNDVRQKWSELEQLVPSRDAQLQREMARQIDLDRARKQFAAKANQVGPWLERHLDMLPQLAAQKGKLEDHLARFRQLEKDVATYRPHMDELERLDSQQESGWENRNTPYLMTTLRIGWEQLQTNILRYLNELENQIMTRDSKGISNEQIEEFRKCFQHFDKSRKRRLDAKEFRACLVSLGFSIREDKQGEAELTRIMLVVDPNQTGFVSFDAFLDFMTREMTDQDSVEQIIDSFRVLAADLPYVTPDVLRRELPPDQAEYCIARMAPYRAANAPPGALDYMSFSTKLYGESDV